MMISEADSARALALAMALGAEHKQMARRLMGFVGSDDLAGFLSVRAEAEAILEARDCDSGDDAKKKR